MKVEEFKAQDADAQRWSLYGLISRHMVDPSAHKAGSRLATEIRDKGPVIGVLTVVIVLLEVLGYT